MNDLFLFSSCLLFFSRFVHSSFMFSPSSRGNKSSKLATAMKIEKAIPHNSVRHHQASKSKINDRCKLHSRAKIHWHVFFFLFLNTEVGGSDEGSWLTDSQLIFLFLENFFFWWVLMRHSLTPFPYFCPLMWIANMIRFSNRLQANWRHARVIDVSLKIRCACTVLNWSVWSGCLVVSTHHGLLCRQHKRLKFF